VGNADREGKGRGREGEPELRERAHAAFHTARYPCILNALHLAWFSRAIGLAQRNAIEEMWGRQAADSLKEATNVIQPPGMARGRSDRAVWCSED
jgi:hypothetical protein